MKKNIVMDADAIKRALTRMTYEIIERNKGIEDMVIVGIKTRGEYLGERIVKRLKELEGVELPFLAIDISAYRDDVDEETRQEITHQSIRDSTVDLAGKHIFLVDDVLQSGRTVRAAMDAVMDIGRASRISLVVLVDRGHRELPIRADIIGKNLPTSKGESVDVLVEEVDKKDAVIIREE